MKLASFSVLSNDDLMARIRALVGVGRRVLAKLIAFLAEVEHRRLHLDSAYSSLQDFCIRALGMSEGEAFRRMTAARMTLRFPSIPDRIARGEIHLSGLVLLRDHLTEDNHDTLLREAAGKTKNGIRELLARRAPRPDVPCSITTIPEQPSLPTQSTEVQVRAPINAPTQTIEPLAPARHRVELTASTELREKIERAVDLMRHSNPKGDLAFVVERAIDLLLETLEKQKFGKTKRPRPAKPSTDPAASRHVSNEVRREVHERDGEQCAFVDALGSRCPSRAFLQHDHQQAWARGGKSDASNVRMLCAAHNRRAAELEFGREHVETCIDMRRRKSRPPPPPVDVAESAEIGELFETARRALRGMGFRGEETSRAIDVMRERTVGTYPPPALAQLIREALGILTDGKHRSS